MYVDKKINKIEDVDKRISATAHLYGVSLAAQMMAKKRGLDPELAAMAGMLHDMYAYKTGSYEDHTHLGADLANKILGKLELSKTEGGIGQYISDSEVETLGLMMNVSNVTPSGVTIHFRQYDDKSTGELTYGEGYTLERLVGQKWEAVPMIIDNGAFTDIGYIIPKNGEAEIETNWEWLYGKLEPGTYKITKLVIDAGVDNKGDSLNQYPISAQFLIAG